MLPAVQRAAELARALEGRVRNDPKQGENAAKQALTEADMAAQEAVLEQLLVHYPGVSLAAEEDTPTVDRFARGSDAVVIIDPIDGTLHSYLEGGGPYAVIVGLAVSGRIVSGLVALPREGLVFLASAGRGAMLCRAGGSPRPVRLEGGGPRILVSHGMPPAIKRRLLRRGYEPMDACGGAVSVAPLIPGVCAGLRYGSSPRGVSIRGRVGALIAVEAGACLLGDDGGPFPLDLETPVRLLRVTAEPADQAVLADALEAAGLC